MSHGLEGPRAPERRPHRPAVRLCGVGGVADDGRQRCVGLGSRCRRCLRQQLGLTGASGAADGQALAVQAGRGGEQRSGGRPLRQNRHLGDLSLQRSILGSDLVDDLLH